MEKRYYWLKFRSDFFDSKRIKKLRNMAGGDTYCIIYLKMQLKALNSGGYLEFTGIEDEFADELALDIDERPDDVKVTLLFLLQYGLCECSDNIHYYLPWVAENTGSETASTQRWREWKKRQDVGELLESNTTPTTIKQIANAEKEIEVDKKRVEKKHIGFVAPTADEVREQCAIKGYEYVDPDEFWLFYDSKDWMIGKNKMAKWQSALGRWNSEHQRRGDPKITSTPGRKNKLDNLQKLYEEVGE